MDLKIINSLSGAKASIKKFVKTLPIWDLDLSQFIEKISLLLIVSIYKNSLFSFSITCKHASLSNFQLKLFKINMF